MRVEEEHGAMSVNSRVGFIPAHFGQALALLKDGKRVARTGWNGRGMFLYLVPGSRFEVNREPLQSIFGAGHDMTYRPHIDMFTADGECVPWIASQTDLLADDWVEVPSERSVRARGIPS